jgi:hypothetical protein
MFIPDPHHRLQTQVAHLGLGSVSPLIVGENLIRLREQIRDDNSQFGPGWRKQCSGPGCKNEYRYLNSSKKEENS